MGGNDAARSTSASPKLTRGAAAAENRRGFGDSDRGTAAWSSVKRPPGRAVGEVGVRVRGRGGQAPRGGADEEGGVRAFSLNRRPRGCLITCRVLLKRRPAFYLGLVGGIRKVPSASNKGRRARGESTKLQSAACREGSLEKGADNYPPPPPQPRPVAPLEYRDVYRQATIGPRAASPRRGAGRGTSAADAARDAGGGESGKKRRSVREIREILENSSFADSDNGRRLALGAARTALESILREASPGPVDRSVGCSAGRGVEGLGEGMAGGVHEVRSVGELREAIRGAVNILAGIGG